MIASRFLLLLGLGCYSLFGQNSIPSVISVNTTLTKNKSPYNLTESTINSGVTLTIEAGVTIILAKDALFKVKGKLNVIGTREDTVVFVSNYTSEYGKISLESGTIELHYVKANVDKMFVYGTGGNVLIYNCFITSSANGNGEDCFSLHNQKRAVFEDNTLIGNGGHIDDGVKNDGIDLDGCDSVFLSKNKISYFGDDAIDVGTQTKYAYIHDNILNNCNYGASIGEQTKAFIINNICSFNEGGLEVHDSALVYCENNILYANEYGIDVFHREYAPAQNGGNVIVKNTIFSQNSLGDIAMQTSSTASISYSLSDKDTLEGTGNIYGDPLFNNPAQGDFTLKNNSPALNAGTDEKGNPINMGLAVRNVPNNTKLTYLNQFLVSVFPNPCKSRAFIKLQLKNKENVELSVITTEGKTITTVYKGILLQGSHMFEWIPGNEPKGVYIFSIKTDSNVLNRKIVVQ